MMLLPPSDQFHVGIVVDDLDGARDALTHSCGYEWGRDMQLEYTMLLPGSSITYQQHLCYSVTEPRLELVQAVAGTPLQPSRAGLHHLGYWCDDVSTTSAALTASGWEWECGGTFPDGSPAWAYLVNPAGLRIELVSRAMAAAVASLWAEAPA